MRTTRRFPTAAVLALFAAACAHAPPHVPAPAPAPVPEPPRAVAPAEPAPPSNEVGMASFYGRRFHGRRTASGTRFDMRALTCAHPSAPFGTKLRVTSLDTGRSVVVTVTDRGPYAPGRVIDLSWAAARTLGIVKRGVARVRVEPLAAKQTEDDASDGDGDGDEDPDG